MVFTIPSIFLLITCIILISTTNAVNLPGNYTLPKDSPNICFAARLDLVLNVEYLKTDGKITTARIPLNNETFVSYDGKCSSDNTHIFAIKMLDGLTTITFLFTLDGKNQTSLSKVFGTITVNDKTPYFPNYAPSSGSIIYAFTANESLFTTDRSNSYRCNSKTKIDNFKSNNNVTLKSIEIENLRVQPFVNNTVVFTDYAVEKVCTMDLFRSPNIIPIIVGVCLGVLVIVVLIAYLIGRRRNRNGYQSV